MASPEELLWMEAAQKEYNCLISKITWQLETLPSSCCALTGKWVLTKKLKEKGEVTRYKAQ
jgi:di/tricarboxylate transporter